MSKVDPSLDSRTFQELIILALTRYPERDALVEGSQRLTVRDLEQRVARTVTAYKSIGIRTGSRIALLGANSAEYVVAQLAAAVLGASFTGLHPLSSSTDTAAVLNLLAPTAFVFDPRSSLDVAKEIVARLEIPDLQILSFGPTDVSIDLVALASEAPASASLSLTQATVTNEDLGAISFTGGTTGLPKGVIRSQRAMACSVTTMLAEWDWPADLRFLAIAPLTHATGSMLPAVLLRGGTVHILTRFDPETVAQQIRENRITATFLVPTMIYRMLERSTAADLDLVSLQLIIYGAAAISVDRLIEGLSRWGHVFMQLYGQVEAPNTICTLRIADHKPDSPRLSSCGKPTLSLDVRLTDDNGVVVPHGEAGEICVRGPLVMDGYLDNPEATTEALRDGWLRTGDMAIRDNEGFLHIVDRRKDMIVSGGFNIFAGDVERSLNLYPGVLECAVIGTPDDTWGEAVTAYVVRAGSSVTEEALIAHVRASKGSAWAPKHINFLDALPLTAVSKPDKKALRALHWPVGGRAVH